MIKLLDIVKEVELQGKNFLDTQLAKYDDLHYNDHMKEIEGHIQKAIANKDPRFIHNQLEEIIKHAQSAQDKVLNSNERNSVHDGSEHIAGFHAKNANF
jgi:hypothetical protein